MKWYTFLITIALLFVQCGGDDDGPDGPTPWNDNFGRVTMKIDGRQLVMRAFKKAVFGNDPRYQGDYILFESVNCEDLIHIELVLTPEIGVHEINGGSFITEKEGRECAKGGDLYDIGEFHWINGNASVTEIGDRLKGTFEFTAVHNIIGKTHVITEGSFDIETEQ